MGDRLRLCFFVKEDHTYHANLVMMWFENDQGNDILNDNYYYWVDYKTNKDEIKKELKALYPNEKGIFKEYKMLINKMKEYESNSF